MKIWLRTIADATYGGKLLIKNVRCDRKNVEEMEWMVIKFCIGLKVFVHNRIFPCGSVTLVLSEVAVDVIQR